MTEYKIIDNRVQSSFKGMTFSGHNKSEVKRTLFQNISDGKIESACHWSAELVCAGHFLDLWELVLLYMSKHIHLGNPKLVIYLDNRYKLFNQIIEDTNFISIIDLRNNVNIRKLFSEIICILCQSKKMHSIELIKINIIDAYIPEKINERLKASSTHYLNDIFREDDPKGLYIALNELAYNISEDSLNLNSACYWIEWIIEYDILHKKMKDCLKCVARSNINVDEQFQTDSVWVIWDVILHHSKVKSLFIQNIISGLLNLFCLKYTPAATKRRRYILYYAVGVIIDIVKIDIEISNDKATLHNVVNNTDLVYKQLKCNEEIVTYHSQSFNDKKKNLECSVRRLELMDSIS